MMPKKLIEVAMPIKEISAESVRDKSIRHGHISTLHLWWARRPLPVCRAVVFASLVPDPLDPLCPQAFKDAIVLLLGSENNPTDPYKPYLDIPWTPNLDPMEDNLRNRLQMFIGKFTPQMQEYLLHQKPKPSANNQVTKDSLIAWESKNNEALLNKARKLIWVAHNAHTQLNANTLLADFDTHYNALKNAEKTYYSILNRQNLGHDALNAKLNLENALQTFWLKMPKVFDPFAGGGAIPLEAARLGCQSFGNDINPVAHIIQKGSLEFPQQFGKAITLSKDAFIECYGIKNWVTLNPSDLIYQNGEVIGVTLNNQLSFDVAFYAKELLERTEKTVGQFYPKNPNGKKPIAYYWARVGTCSNPSCKAEVPLLKGFYLANTATKQVHLNPIIEGTNISFEIKSGNCNLEGWNHRANLKCPCCGSITDVKSIKQQSVQKTWSQRLLAVIEEGEVGKNYRLPTDEEIKSVGIVPVSEVPNEKMQRNSAGGDTFSWGVNEWGQMFSNRQLFTLQTLVQNLNELKKELSAKFKDETYPKALLTYLAIWIDKISSATTSFGRWNVGGEKIETPFSKQAIPMMFDYPEGNIFSGVTGSALNQLNWITRYIESESGYPFYTQLQNASSGEKAQFAPKSITAVITDPPYYDAIAYADLSDFFYVWLKRTLGSVYPLNFATPQTPKAEECTALKHHHSNNKDQAKQHFEQKLTQIFDAISHQTTDMVSIMFAHQSTEAWTTLCNAILNAKMNITGSWSVDTEMTNRSLGLAGDTLSSSVTVSCKPSQRQGFGNYKTVKSAIENTISVAVENLYSLGFRGADLLTACFGQAVSEFGKYEVVEKLDGSPVTVAELLELARESAFNALLKGFAGDEPTKFYIGWLQLYGFAPSPFDDAAKFSRVGLSINVQELIQQHVLIKSEKGDQRLAAFQDRLKAMPQCGTKIDSPIIDQIQRALYLYHQGNRGYLLQYLNSAANRPDHAFWRVLAALREVLPNGTTDYIAATGLESNKENLLSELKNLKNQPIVEQVVLDL